MGSGNVCHINIDGGARGNPGPAAYACVIRQEGLPVIEDYGCIGKATNNIAEYTALVRALERASQLETSRLAISSDSELLVKQMNGEYRVKDSGLRALFDEAKQLCRRFDHVSIRHIPRAENSRADELCNMALDGHPPPNPAAQPLHALSRHCLDSPNRSAREEAVCEDAIACLQAAASAWSHGNARHPSPEQVWEQLWTILEDGGVLRKPRPS